MRSDLGSMFRPPEGLLRGIRPCPGDDKGLALCHPGCLCDHPVMLPPVQRGGFPCRSRRDEVGSVFDLKPDVLLQPFKIDLSFTRERRDHRGPAAFNSLQFHRDPSPFFRRCCSPIMRQKNKNEKRNFCIRTWSLPNATFQQMEKTWTSSNDKALSPG